MTINEIEALSGMKYTEIQFYEQEGLIHFESLTQDASQDYSDNELQMLLRIKLLASLHVSLDDIKALKNGEKSLSEILLKQIIELEKEKDSALYAQDICRVMQQDKVAFDNLNAKKYLDDMEYAKEHSNSSDNTTSYVFYPWRRYFARMLDLSIYNVIWTIILSLVFHVSLTTRSGLMSIVDTFIAFAIMLFLEPLLLSKFRTTFGKAVFGLRIELANGNRISYSEALDRTWGVIVAGLGFNIPIYSLFRLWRSYKLCREDEIEPWDEYTNISYTVKDTKWYRTAIYIAVNIIVFILIIIVVFAEWLPPNRGELTIAEFAENYNYYMKYFGINYNDEYLDENGNWAQEPMDGVAYLNFPEFKQPQYNYIVKDGNLTEVSFSVVLEDEKEWIGGYDTYMNLAALAFGSAQEEIHIFSQEQRYIAEQITNNALKDFNFTEVGITFACNVDYIGYIDMQSNILIREEEAEKAYFALDFSMKK